MEPLIAVLLAVLVAFALYWEWLSWARVQALPRVEDLPVEQRQRASADLACYTYDTGVNWRSAYLGALLIAFILWYILGCRVSWREWLLVILIIFIVTYGIGSLLTFHVTRVICSRAKGDVCSI